MKPPIKIVAVAAAAVAIVGAVVVLSSSEQPRIAPPPGAASEPLVKASPPQEAPLSSEAPLPGGISSSPTPLPAVPDEEPTTAATSVQEDPPEDVHYYNGLDPNQQPRSFFHQSLAGMRTVPDGYETTGDFHLSQAGWTLKPAAPGEEGEPRIGMIESPALPLEFQSNAVNPLWKETSPTGTEVLVEVSLSQDGATWTDWMPTTSAHYEGEMSATYPDGRPNPNYGYTLGDMTFYGLTRFRYFRYAITMYSETQEAPVVSDFRLFYQDSTMGDAELAQAQTQENPPTAGGSPQ